SFQCGRARSCKRIEGDSKTLSVWEARRKGPSIYFTSRIFSDDVFARRHHWIWRNACCFWCVIGRRFGSVYFVYVPNHCSDGSVFHVFYATSKGKRSYRTYYCYIG